MHSFLSRLSHPPKSLTQKTSCFCTSTALTSAQPPHLLQLLSSSISQQSLHLSRQSHALVISFGLDQHSILATKLISAYSICGALSASRRVFDSVRCKNTFIWNSLISGYAKNGVFGEPFRLFNQMCVGLARPDNYTLATLSKICGELGVLGVGKMIHCRIMRTGFFWDTVVANSLMSMYRKCDSLTDARDMFDEIPYRSVASWNILISEFALSGDSHLVAETWELVKRMQLEGMKPDAFTVAIVLPLCTADFKSRSYGREIHCFMIRNELDVDSDSDIHMGSCLVDMYSRSNNIVMGRRVFDKMEHKNVVVWTAMIAGYVQNGGLEQALLLFRAMQDRGIQPNRISLLTILSSCGSLATLMEGKQIHAYAIRQGMNNDVSLSNALIDMYSKCGSLKMARFVFDDDSYAKDPISWSSIITSYGLHGRGEEAVALFMKMLQLGINPDAITSVGILSACSRGGLLKEGFEVYNLLTSNYGILPTMEMYSCMVDMLGRTGQLDRALDFISSMHMQPGPSIWGALVSASVVHGRMDMQDLAYRSLLLVEPENPSNYVSLSNVYASSGKWDSVAGLRMRMRERSLRKLPGCSWINVNSKIHCFYVADKSHPCLDSIHSVLNNLTMMIKGDCIRDLSI